QAEQRIVGRNSLNPREHAIETRIAQNLDPIRSNAQLLQPERILRRDRGGYGDGAVSRFQQPPSEPAKTTAARAYRRGYERQVGPSAGRSSGQFGPDVELGEHQQV